MTREPSHLGVYLAALLPAQVALDQGRVATAAQLLREVVASLDGRDPSDWTFMSLVELAQALGMAGDAVGARRVLESAGVGKDVGMGSLRF